jgi:hypothetical protein
MLGQGAEHPKTYLSTVSLASNIRLNASPHLKLSRPYIHSKKRSVKEARVAKSQLVRVYDFFEKEGRKPKE